ncbi:hypothetical protein KBX37_27275 [Micromonospora sp. U56]|uniref:DUF6283 family protein n=1 Tax=Micromonospora sp. U56 TaxID=2824900 RepID=UPI001B37AD25|nr:DUF6283 family protein [Micromonospora sp. U56]MBQ0896750.1 hypothetical protein [Micromonospora sp. U56]
MSHPYRRRGSDEQEPIFETSGPDGASLRCRVCGAVDEVVQDEMPSMAGYGADTYARCAVCGSVEISDPVFGWRAKPAVWPQPGEAGADADRASPVSNRRAGVRGPATAPCGTCPYRRDVPSGVWDASEYSKLPDYDQPTALQPPGLFLCHQADGRVCAGWAGCHDTDNLLALRLAALHAMDPDEVTATRDYVCPVPLFDSGAAAAAHGMAGIDNPDARARRAIHRLHPKVTARALPTLVRELPVPAAPADGDCLTWAPATAERLRQHGYPAQVISVAGWTDEQARIISFVHRTVLIAEPGADPAGWRIVDVTARQFDPTLPARWLTSWHHYLTALADATGVQRVTRWPQAT